MKHWPFQFFSALILLPALGANCSGSQGKKVALCVAIAGGKDTNEFLQFDRELRTAASKNDPLLLTLLAEFPLAVNDDTGRTSIEDAATLYARIGGVFTEEVRSAILGTESEDLICHSGGIGYGRGEVWVQVREQDGAERYLISSINLGTRAARKETGVRFVCRTDDQRSAVDVTSDGALRYRSWKRPRTTAEKPDSEILPGVETWEGTGPCAHRVWSFKNGSVVSSVSELGCWGEDKPPDGAIGELTIETGNSEMKTAWCY